MKTCAEEQRLRLEAEKKRDSYAKDAAILRNLNRQAGEDIRRLEGEKAVLAAALSLVRGKARDAQKKLNHADQHLPAPQIRAAAEGVLADIAQEANGALSGEGKPKDHYCPDCADWHNIEMENARRGWLEVREAVELAVEHYDNFVIWLPKARAALKRLEVT